MPTHSNSCMSHCSRLNTAAAAVLLTISPLSPTPSLMLHRSRTLTAKQENQLPPTYAALAMREECDEQHHTHHTRMACSKRSIRRDRGVRCDSARWPLHFQR